ncbi:glycosyltransferase family 39 protein [Candidatus Binatus sp.]|uniref:glycosyltransferase family 39 protein n=1 Tax=Candidatus Binatus sp. TaxID=2811406 RepID=UPI002F91CA54
MTEAGSATIESLSGDRPSRRPLEIFAAIFVVAGLIYSSHLGANALGASEAYSAWAAAKPGVGAIVRTPVLHDPGKQVFYYVVLHYYTQIFGLSEISLRSMSVIFSLVTLALVFALGCEMFDKSTALAAAAMWAFNPLAVVFAHTARMYPMLIAIALAHLLTLLRVRSRPGIIGGIGCGILGAAMAYTHLAGLLILGAEAAILLRDLSRGRRDTIAWLAIALAIVLFLPYLPVAIGQSQQMIYGHWLDYLGPPYNYPLAAKLAAGLVAAGVTCWLVLGRTVERDGNEPIRVLAAWIGLPALAFIVGSVILHPMFNPRYLSPGIAASPLLIAAVIGAWSAKWRNLLAAGFVVACLIMLPFARSKPPPWRDLAGQVAGGGASEPVFFESGFVSNASTANVPNGGFPFGYYSVPFDYYFRGANPRIAIPGFDAAAARMTIEERVSSAGGGWLVSWKDSNAVKSELPDPKRFTVVEKFRGDHLTFYRITPSGRGVPVARPAK